MSDLEKMPKVILPNTGWGTTNRNRKLYLELKCQNSFRQIGWLLFGKDGSLYFHRKGQSPILEVGNAIVKEGKLIKTDKIDISSVLDEQKVGTHLSLHPSGEVHVKSYGQKPLTVSNIGTWLPVIKPFLFAYIFTEPVGKLEVVERSNTNWIVNDPDKSVRLDIIISPQYKNKEMIYTPLNKSTMWFGHSPRYSILVNAYLTDPCESYMFFLSSPAYTEPPNNK